jgi:HKD family nuclease
MEKISLISSPGGSYRDQIVGAIDRAQHVVLVTAFASPSGIEEVARPLRALLARPGTSARVIVAVDRRGFNVARAFGALLALRGDAGKRFSLGIVPEQAGLLHAKALFAKGPAGVELIVGSANLTTSALRANHELALLVEQAGPDLEAAFHRFLDSLAPQSLDGSNELAGALGFEASVAEASTVVRLAAAVCCLRRKGVRWEGADLSPDPESPLSRDLVSTLEARDRRVREETDRALRAAALVLLAGKEIPSAQVELGTLGLRRRREDYL